jgi:very-short-patch-repair endonuclease
LNRPIGGNIRRSGRLARYRLRTCTPGGGWIQEAAVLDDIHVDFYHAASRVAVELDGGYHTRMSYLTTSARTNRVITFPAQPDLDARRDQRLAHVGIEVIRVHDYHTLQPEILGHIIDRIRQRVSERSASTSAPVIQDCSAAACPGSTRG